MFIYGLYIIFGKFNLVVREFCSFIGQEVSSFIAYNARVSGNMTERDPEGNISRLQYGGNKEVRVGGEYGFRRQ